MEEILNSKKTLPILFLVMFLVMIGFGIIIPVLPFYAEELGATATELGWLMAVYSIMQLIFAPLWGTVSDKIGRKPVMLIGIVGLSLSFFLLSWATDLWMLFMARIIGGVLSGANMPTAMAYVADITSEEDRGKGMGIIGAAAGLGFIFGPALGGIFSEPYLQLPFFIAGCSSLLTAFFVLFILKESLSPEKRRERNTEKKSSLNILRGPLLNLFILQFFVAVSLAGLEATFAYFAAIKADLNTVRLGYIFMIMGLAQAIVQGGLLGKLTKRFSEGFVIQLGILISAVGFFLILFVNNFITAAIYLTIFGIGNGLIRPAVSALLTKRTDSGHGQVTGTLSSFDSFGRIVGPPLGGALFTVSIGYPYIAGVILSLIAFIIYRLYATKDKQLMQSKVVS